eukprot:14526771-Heterocapsa_arctica.AAC.1
MTRTVKAPLMYFGVISTDGEHKKIITTCSILLWRSKRRKTPLNKLSRKRRGSTTVQEATKQITLVEEVKVKQKGAQTLPHLMFQDLSRTSNGFWKTQTITLFSYKSIGGYQMKSKHGNRPLSGKDGQVSGMRQRKHKQNTEEGRPGKSGGVAIL